MMWLLFCVLAFLAFAQEAEVSVNTTTETANVTVNTTAEESPSVNVTTTVEEKNKTEEAKPKYLNCSYCYNWSYLHDHLNRPISIREAVLQMKIDIIACKVNAILALAEFANEKYNAGIEIPKETFDEGMELLKKAKEEKSKALWREGLLKIVNATREMKKQLSNETMSLLKNDSEAKAIWMERKECIKNVVRTFARFYVKRLKERILKGVQKFEGGLRKRKLAKIADEVATIRERIRETFKNIENVNDLKQLREQINKLKKHVLRIREKRMEAIEKIGIPVNKEKMEEVKNAIERGEIEKAKKVMSEMEKSVRAKVRRK